MMLLVSAVIVMGLGFLNTVLGSGIADKPSGMGLGQIAFGLVCHLAALVMMYVYAAGVC